MTKTTFKATPIQYLYRREPIGIYYARLNRRGKQIWISLRTKMFAVAKAELHKRLSEYFPIADAESLIREGTATVENLAALYIENVHLDQSLKTSPKEYRGKTIKYLFRSWPALKDKPPGRVTEAECRRWAAEYRAQFSPTLYNNTVDSLRNIFELAISKGLIARNPANAVERIRVPQRKLELPSRSEFHAIVAAVRDAGSGYSAGNGDLVEFLAYSGLRATEASLVRWQDIDLDRSRIYVAPGKNSQSRYVPILDPMRDLLAKIKATPRWYRNDQRRVDGYLLSVTTCDDALTSACRKVGVARLVRHDLRHLFATRCIESGVDIPTVSRWLGHKDGGALAMKTYGHLRDEHSQAMAAKVNF